MAWEYQASCKTLKIRKGPTSSEGCTVVPKIPGAVPRTAAERSTSCDEACEDDDAAACSIAMPRKVLVVGFRGNYQFLFSICISYRSRNVARRTAEHVPAECADCRNELASHGLSFCESGANQDTETVAKRQGSGFNPARVGD